MTIESVSVTYISGLVASNPAGAADRGEADDHLRLIKAAIKATFSNVAGAVAVTATELNTVVGLSETVAPTLAEFSKSISALTTQLNSISVAAASSGAFADVGWFSLTATGSSFVLTGIPTNVFEVSIFVERPLVTPTSASAQMTLSLGSAAGVEVLGYEGKSSRETAADFSAGFPVFVGCTVSISVIARALVTLRNLDTGGTLWTMHAATSVNTLVASEFHAGQKTLAGTLDRIQFSISKGSFKKGQTVFVHCRKRSP